MGCCGRSDRLTIAVVAEKYGNKIWRPPHVEPIAGADGVPEDQQILSDHHSGPADKEKENDIGHRRCLFFHVILLITWYYIKYEDDGRGQQSRDQRRVRPRGPTRVALDPICPLSSLSLAYPAFSTPDLT
jgi:hypothetical protein